ncbi:glycosyltransferase family 2 protein [Pseudoxanthomonas gei]|nr:glycosyltransferase family 2 protein [Pseudoxanthomonas gei]
MTALAIPLFWSCVCLVAWAYIGYPLLTRWLARHRGQEPRISAAPETTPPVLTVVVCAFDEETRIGARISDILAQDYPGDCLQVLVVSDGSRDRTVDVAAEVARDDPRVRVLALPGNVGKAAAVNAAMTRTHTALVAFTDVRQRYAPGALRALVAPFADPRVGAVSGELMILDPPPAPSSKASAVEGGIYWRMEKRLRSDEARLQWLHGVSGSVYALRRELFRPIPPGTILDDMWVPLQVILAGRWVWMSRDAIAYDQASAHASEEFARKLRTLAGNWQLLALLPTLLDPTRNRVFFAWFSHKFLRLVVPWAMLLALLCSALAPGAFYRLALLAQLSGYAAASLGLRLPQLARRIPLLSAAGTFVMLNLASLLSLPASLSGDSSRLWKKH